MKVTAVVLAAGASRRMGQVKQALPFGKSTVLGSVLDALQSSRVARTIVVLGHHADAARKAVGHRPVEEVVNPEPDRGMLSSVQCGVAAVHDADAFLIALGDQPQLGSLVVDRLIDAAEGSSRSIFVPVYGGKRGHPLLLRAKYREEILSLQLSKGLNTLLAAHPDEIEEIEMDSPDILEDLDTPEEYERAVTKELG